jgi:hypothetical protein
VRCVLLLLGLCLACNANTPPVFAGVNPADCPEVMKVSIVSRIGDSGEATGERKYARADQTVNLWVIVETRGAGRFSDAPLKPAKDLRSSTAWPVACPVQIDWFKVEAQAESYNNAYSAPPAEIAYAETEWNSGWGVVADVHPTIMHDEFPDVKNGLGTMRYKAQAQTAAGTASSKGMECRESGAACRAIHTVVNRADDTYLGFLYELYNTPYIYGSKRIKGGHQSDLLVGSDCADFTVYGKRRQRGKKNFGYTYTGGLYKLASKRWKVSLDAEEFYIDKKTRRLTFGPEGTVRPGDLINFDGGHVGALVKDDGDGYLDTGDYVMHTLFREPETVPIKDCRWGSVDGKEVLRLKKK